MWCCVVWCGVMWCGVVWCDVVWCGVTGLMLVIILAIVIEYVFKFHWSQTYIDSICFLFYYAVMLVTPPCGSCKDLSKQLKRLLRGLTHDSFEVRLMALEKLKQVLQDNKVGGGGRGEVGW